LDNTTTTPIDALIKDLPGSDDAKAETIENNLQHEIVKKMSSNEVYYGKLSEMLQVLVDQRRIEALSYEEYLRQVVELAQAILHPEDSADYPAAIKDSEARRAFFDYFDKDEELAVNVDTTIRSAIRPAWKKNRQKQNNIQDAIYKTLLASGYDDETAAKKTHSIYDIAGRQVEYDE